MGKTLHQSTYIHTLFDIKKKVQDLICASTEALVLLFKSVQVGTPRMDMTLAELQEMAARQQQQIEAQQQLLASKVNKRQSAEKETGKVVSTSLD